MADPDLTVLLLLALAALVAGSVGAVVGGGGLVLPPALLIGLPGARHRCRSWRPTRSRRSVPMGAVLWKVGLVMRGFNLLGGYSVGVW